MIVLRGRSLALVGAAVASLVVTVSAMAAPLLIGDTECGELKKRTVDGRVVWQIKGCAPLEDLVNPPAAACNNGILDTDEFCDQSASLNGCSTGETCVGCVECTSTPIGGTPTPTPNPGATPTPPPVIGGNCPQGELPPLSSEEFGRLRVPIDDGATHTYCFTLNAAAVGLDFDVIDATGGIQCFWADQVRVTPPPGSGLSSTTSFGGNAHIGYFLSGFPIPNGIYLLSVRSRTDSGCGQRYTVSARYR